MGYVSRTQQGQGVKTLSLFLLCHPPHTDLSPTSSPPALLFLGSLNVSEETFPNASQLGNCPAPANQWQGGGGYCDGILEAHVTRKGG